MADNNSGLVEELTAIKRLLIFALLQQPGITQSAIATALGTSQSQISKMLGAGGKAK
jgi:DNA-binding MarR family transcriptional regulator